MRYTTPEIDQICAKSRRFCDPDERFPILIGFLDLQTRSLLTAVFHIAHRLEEPFQEHRHPDVLDSLYDLADTCDEAAAIGELVREIGEHPSKPAKIDRSWARWQAATMREFSRLALREADRDAHPQLDKVLDVLDLTKDWVQSVRWIKLTKIQVRDRVRLLAGFANALRQFLSSLPDAAPFTGEVAHVR